MVMYIQVYGERYVVVRGMCAGMVQSRPPVPGRVIAGRGQLSFIQYTGGITLGR